MSKTPIGDYALISDCHSAALVSRDGSIDWMCFPRFDGPSVFGRILDDAAGHWAIAPTQAGQVTRRYLDRTMVLETTFRTDAGSATLTDAIALHPSQEGHDLGAGAPRVVLRRVKCIDGEIELEMEFAPRPEYGLVYPLLARVDGGLTTRGGAQTSVLSTPEAPSIERSTARLRLRLSAGQAASFAMQRRTTEETPPQAFSQREIEDLLAGTIEEGQTWPSLHQAYEGPWTDRVYHSGRGVQALTY